MEGSCGYVHGADPAEDALTVAGNSTEAVLRERLANLLLRAGQIGPGGAVATKRLEDDAQAILLTPLLEGVGDGLTQDLRDAHAVMLGIPVVLIIEGDP